MPDTQELPQEDEETSEDIRREVRNLIEADTSSGYLPLRKYEKHRAYYCLTGEKLEDASAGEVAYRLLELIEEEFTLYCELRDPFDCGGPLVKDELRSVRDALAAEVRGESCPEFDCGLTFNTEAELIAHLQHDHNRSEKKAQELIA